MSRLASRHDPAHLLLMPAPPRPIATPCVKVCFVDDESGLCLGCYRTMAEIAGWTRLTDAARVAVMAELEDRAALIRPEKLGAPS